MTDYLVVYEQADDGGWGAYLPDLPGVVAMGASRDEVERLIHEGVEIYVEEMAADERLPAPVAAAGTITI
jgi:predicted RNase H-like HicB family nuclease